MPKKLAITLDGFNYAAKLMQVDLHQRFGELEWEKALQRYSTKFCTLAVHASGDRLINAPPKRNEQIRRALTMIFGAVYYEMGMRLPHLSPGAWVRVVHLYPLTDGQTSLNPLTTRVMELLHSVDEYWAKQWDWIVSTDVMNNEHFTDDETWQLCAMVLVLMAEVLNENFEITPKDPTPEAPAAEATVQQTRAQTLIPTVTTDVTFDDVGGCHLAKQKFRRLALGLKNPGVWTSWGSSIPRGVLAWGPPGTGKTLLCKALAHETGRRFFYVKSGDIVDMWYGLSPKNMARVVEDAAKDGGGIIFFDEAEALFGSRDNMSHEETIRMIGTFNAAVDGLTRPQDVLIVFATNRRDLMDTAVIREGRVDLIVECPMPDPKDRVEILDIHLNAALKRTRAKLFAKLDTKVIADATDGFSGSGIAEMVRRALELKAYQQAMTGTRPGPVTMDDIMFAIREQRRERTELQARQIGYAQAVRRA